MTTATLLTPRAPGAIAVIAVRGPDATRLAHELGARVPAPGSVTLAHLADHGRPLDDALVVTHANDHLELHLHGGVGVVDAILAALNALGCTLRPATPDDAFASAGELERDVLAALPSALTDTAVTLLAAQPTALAEWAGVWRTRLAHDVSLAALHSDCQWLLDRARALGRLLTPARVALVGPPSAGKSSLANALLGRPVAITSPVPGTTRDWVDALATFSSGDARAPVTLVDTAGLRVAADDLEAASIDRTHQQAARADVILFVVDGSRPLPPDAGERLAAYAAGRIPTILVANQSDRPPADHPALVLRPLAVSALAHAGLDALMTATLAHLRLTDLSPVEPWPCSPRLQSLLNTLAHTNDLSAAVAVLQALAS